MRIEIRAKKEQDAGPDGRDAEKRQKKKGGEGKQVPRRPEQKKQKRGSENAKANPESSIPLSVICDASM